MRLIPNLETYGTSEAIKAMLLEQVLGQGYVQIVAGSWPIDSDRDFEPLEDEEVQVAVTSLGQRKVSVRSKTLRRLAASTTKSVGYDTTEYFVAHIAPKGNARYYDAYFMLAVGEKAEVTVAARTHDAAMAVYTSIQNRLPKIKLTDDSVTLNFWSAGAAGPTMRARKIAVPTWESIAGNYTPSVYRELSDSVFVDEIPEDRGRLILWSGVPGTGKTYAIRALMQHHRNGAIFDYVTDPEQFFGGAGYMMNVIMGSDSGEYSISDTQRRKFRLVIIEDAGELMAKDAKERVGQSLSRLLNMCDGLIGQGLRLFVLITTNEDVGRMHPAVTRPGRCLSRVEFRPFPVQAARSWLSQQDPDHDPNVVGAMTLADLYATLRGGRVEESSKVGF